MNCESHINVIGFNETDTAFQFVISPKAFEVGCVYTMPVCVRWRDALDGTQIVQLFDGTDTYNIRLNACQGGGVTRLGNLRSGMRLRMVYTSDTLDGVPVFTLIHPVCPLRFVVQEPAAPAAG